MTRIVSAAAARNVPKLSPMLISAAQRRSPQTASSSAPAIGVASSTTNSTYWSSFSDSRWCRSRLSNCSRIWKKKTPSTSIATSTSSATPSSTIIGMP
jgi:hypothetical protein